MWWGASLWVWAAEPGTTTVYRSVDSNGVVSFSDAPHASAVPIEVVPPRLPLQDDVERANARFEQQLALLELLETSRRARAKEDLEQQRMREREATQSSVQFFPWFPPFWGSPRPPGIHPPPIDRPPPPPPRRVPLPH